MTTKPGDDSSVSVAFAACAAVAAFAASPILTTAALGVAAGAIINSHLKPPSPDS